MAYHGEQPNRRPNGKQMLTISVKNFGPIAEGSVDLKPLTIFVGPSNTGKSYMATAVHMVLQGFVDHKYRFRLRYDDYDDYRAMLHSIMELLSSQCESELARKELAISALPDWISSQILKTSQNLLSNVQQSVIRRLNRVVEIPDGAVDQPGYTVVVHRENPPLNVLLASQTEALTSPEFSISKALISLAEFDLSPPLPGMYDDDGLYPEIVDSLDNSILDLLLSEFPSASIYLPAARSGMVLSHKALASSIIRQASQAGIRTITVPTLPELVAEFLSNLIALDQRRKKEDSLGVANAVEFIETSVMQGLVDFEESGELPYPEISYRTTSGNFLLHQTSSMVTELAPLILFLKYLVRPGDLLILEEPESHLHPAAQLQLARGIARLVNAGVQVLITTHSGDFMGQIDNLLRMSNSREETARSLGLEQEDRLSPEQVSAYGFRIDPDKGGAVTYTLPVGSDVGIEDDEFLPVAELLYHQALELEDARLT